MTTFSKISHINIAHHQKKKPLLFSQGLDFYGGTMRKSVEPIRRGFARHLSPYYSQKIISTNIDVIRLIGDNIRHQRT